MSCGATSVGAAPATSVTSSASPPRSLCRGEVDHRAVDAHLARRRSSPAGGCANAAGGGGPAPGPGAARRARPGPCSGAWRGGRRRRGGTGAIIRGREQRHDPSMPRAVASPALGPRRGALSRPCCARAGARGLRPASRRQGRDRQLVCGPPLPGGARGDAAGQLYAGDQALRPARGALSVRALRAAGDPRIGVRELARQRDRGRHRGRRPLHPHLSQSSQRRLRVLPQGTRPFPRGPGRCSGYVYELDLSERDPKEMRARSPRSRSSPRKFPESQYYQDSIARMRYLTNAMAHLRGEGGPLLLQPRRLRGGRQPRAGGARQVSADAGEREGARHPAQELREARPDAAGRRLAAILAKTFPESRYVDRWSRQAVVAVLAEGGLRRAGHGPDRGKPWWQFWD